jgi:hypothetical protein
MKRLSLKITYVGIYHIERLYGGPEEGGWWYNQRTLVSKVKAFDPEKVDAFVERAQQCLDTWHPDNHISLGSTSCECHYRVQCFDNELPHKCSPEHKPHYE